MSDEVSPLPPAQPAPAAAPSSTGVVVGSESATAALICAIVGLFVCGLLELYPLIKGFNARSEAKRVGGTVDGTLNIAWIISLVAVVLWVLTVIFVAPTIGQ